MKHRKTGAEKISQRAHSTRRIVVLFLPWPTYKEEIKDDGTRVSKMQESTHLRQARAQTITVTPTGRTWDLRFRSRILRQGSVTLPRSCAPLSQRTWRFFSILLGWFGKTVREWLCCEKRQNRKGKERAFRAGCHWMVEFKRFLRGCFGSA